MSAREELMKTLRERIAHGPAFTLEERESWPEKYLAACEQEREQLLREVAIAFGDEFAAQLAAEGAQNVARI